MRKIETLLSACFLVLSQWSTSQITFQKTYGGPGNDEGRFIQQTTDGGYIMTGGVFGYGATDENAFLIKLDSKGDTLWTKSYGGSNSDWGNCVQQTTDGGFIVAGFTFSFGVADASIYIIKTDMNGDTLWTRVFQNGNFESKPYIIKQTTDGGYIIGGQTSLGTLVQEMLLMKLSPNGNLEWNRLYGGDDTDYAVSVLQTSDGGFILPGWSLESFGPGQYLSIVRTNSVGDPLWIRVLETPADFSTTGIIQLSDNSFVVSGSTVIGPRGCLIHFDENGNLLWSKSYAESTNHIFGVSVDTVVGGGIILFGYENNFGAGSTFYFMIKTNDNGDILWSQTYGEFNDFDWVYNGEQTADGGFIMAGLKTMGNNPSQAYLVKTDATGNSGCDQVITAFTAEDLSVTSVVFEIHDTVAAFIEKNTNSTLGGGIPFSTRCTSVGIQEAPENTEVTLLPNPVQARLFINLTIPDDGITIQVYDVQGKMIALPASFQTNQVQLNTTALVNGFYALQIIYNRTGICEIAKFVKQD